MGVVVKPKNLNERQMKRIDRIRESNPERARTVSDRISARRDARGAANPQLAPKPVMKKGGVAKAEKGGSFGKASGKADTYTDYSGKTSKPDSYTQYKKGGVVKKAKSGFGMLSVKAGIDKNPNPTQADRIAGAKGMAKSGKKVAKKMMKSGGTVSMQLGTYTRQIGKNYTGKNVVNKGAKAKMGKSVGKCKSGC